MGSHCNIIRWKRVHIEREMCPERESNPHPWFRRPVLYPLSYRDKKLQTANEVLPSLVVGHICRGVKRLVGIVAQSLRGYTGVAMRIF